MGVCGLWDPVRSDLMSIAEGIGIGFLPGQIFCVRLFSG